MKYALVPLLFAVLLAGLCLAGEPVQLKDENDRVNYAIGYKIGKDFPQQGAKVNLKVLMKGIEDGSSGAKPQMTMEEMRQTMIAFSERTQAARQAKKQQAKEQYRGEGREFLAANAKKEGVVTLPSGLQYKIIKKGTGKKPGPQDTVTVNYRGTLIDGTEFDSSYRNNKPATFRVDGVIKGWTEALQLMQEGAKWQLFIPADLAYGERGPLADKTLIFEVELLSVKSGERK